MGIIKHIWISVILILSFFRPSICLGYKSPFGTIDQFLGVKPKREPRRFLFTVPKCGGFNNQLSSIYKAVLCAKQQNRILVLPFMFENVRYDASIMGEGPYPFEDYYNITHLRSFVKCATPFELDKIGLPCRSLYLLKSSIPFCQWTHWLRGEDDFILRLKAFYKIPRLVSEHYARRYQLRTRYIPQFELGRRNVSCITDSLCNNSTKLGIFSEYGKSGQGYDIRRSFHFRSIRSAFRPSALVEELSSSARLQLPVHYNALHIRRGDYAFKCAAMRRECKEFGPEAFYQSPYTIIKAIRSLNRPNLPLFVSSTHDQQVFEALQCYNLTLFFMKDIRFTGKLQRARSRVDLISMVSQIVASEAQEFIGNRFSSYTAEINNMRFMKNNSDVRHFF